MGGVTASLFKTTRMNQIIRPEQALKEVRENFPAYKKWQEALETPPKKSAIKDHPFIKLGAEKYKYIPVYIIRALLKHFTGGLFKIEVRSISQIINGVTCHVRVHYYNPFTEEWMYHDGVGAASFQMNSTPKGQPAHSPTNFEEVKQTAIEMAVPKAKTQAFKNACQEMGAAFGSNLNKGVETFGFNIQDDILNTFTDYSDAV